MKHDWLKASLIKGLQGLLMLRFQGAPAEDTIASLANAWLAVLTHLPHTWDQDRDQRRIQKAFVRLAASCDRWPAPKHFIEMLPPIEPLLKLDSPKGKYTDESREMVKKLLAKMKGDPITP
tara:strand:- start:646 stop:1008 length:363 start_codon:yes stop_codon:yes gene_type:complete